MQGEKAERGNALGEKEGSEEKGQAARQAAVPPLSLSSLSRVCVSLLAALAAASGQLA